MLRNSVLVCIKCNKSWLASNRVHSKRLNRLLNSFNNRSIEFKLSLEALDDDTRANNVNKWA